MELENLFKLIREEKVTLFIGSGLSLYAGYPSGNGFGKILYNGLTQTEKNEIDENLTLPNLSEEIYRSRLLNKNYLNSKIIEVFGRIPKSKEYHEKLALIPHFKTIITTNYDTLIEDSFKDNCKIVRADKDLGYLNKKIEVFKIHGDINSIENIILTETDYNNFFKNNQDRTTFWEVVSERLTTKNILFLGFNLEDSNIKVIFDRIISNLNEHKKESFLIAPDLKKSKENFLNSKGIHYINNTGEAFITLLLKNIQQNIIEDIEQNIVSLNTGKLFLNEHNIDPTFKTSSDITSVIPSFRENENNIGKFELKIEGSKQLREDLFDVLSGNKVLEVELNDETLKNLDLSYNDISFLKNKKGGKFKILALPNYQKILTIQFSNGDEFDNITTDIYGLKEGVEIHCQFSSAKLKINILEDKFKNWKIKFKFTHNKLSGLVTDEVKSYKLLVNLFKGLKFSIFEKSEYITEYQIKDIASKKEIENFEFFLNYFEKLKQIENYFNIKFPPFQINEVNDNNYTLIRHLICFINKDSLLLKSSGDFTITTKSPIPNNPDLIENIEKGKIIYINSKKTTIKLLKKSFDIGYLKQEHNELKVREIKGCELILFDRNNEFIATYVDSPLIDVQ